MSTAISCPPYRGVTDDWITPPQLVKALGKFDLDPCECEPQPWLHAPRGYTKADDGLTQRWQGRVWLNPPYGPDTEKWVLRLALHGNGIALVQARIETRWFRDTVWEFANGILVMQGRPTFYRPDGTKAMGNSGGPCVFAAFGEQNVDSLYKSKIPGVVIPAWQMQ